MSSKQFASNGCRRRKRKLKLLTERMFFFEVLGDAQCSRLFLFSQDVVVATWD